MKTIQVTDEMYNSLMELSNELKTQSHRGTAMPYFFQVSTKHQVSCAEGNGKEAWHYDGSLIEDKEDIIQAIYDYHDGDKTKKEIKNLSEWELDSEMETAGYRKVNYDYEQRLENAFFTEKACKEHIKNNSHNLSSPVDYLSHAFRNPEMELVMKFLCGLNGGKMHK